MPRARAPSCERGVRDPRETFADRTLLRRLIGAGLAWCLLDVAYYGNTVSSSLIIETLAPKANNIHSNLIALGGMDRFGRRAIQEPGFVMTLSNRSCRSIG